MSELSGTSEDSLGWVYPAQPATGPSAPPEFIEESLSGIMQLIDGQSYIDVTFTQSQSSGHWTFLDCRVVNTSDPTPLNIWAGIVSVKTRTGFRAQLNGMPDSGNYYLHWSIIEAPPVSPDATTYYFTGASSGKIGVAATFAVSLPINTFLEDPVTVTPDDSGGGGAFTPVSVELSEEDTVATFTYTPASYGVKTLNVNNSGALTDPDAVGFTSTAASYTLAGPTGGVAGIVSTDFTVELPAGGVVVGTVTVTPSDGGDGGTFTPTTVGLTTAAPSTTFTYTPASGGAKTISVTNSGGLTNPANLTYTATAPPLADGDPVTTWVDSSLNGHNATQSGSARPTFKTNIVNTKPVVRFTSAGLSGLNIVSTISGVTPWAVFAVMKQAGATRLDSVDGSDGGSPRGPLLVNTGGIFLFDRTGYVSTSPAIISAGFHVFTGISAVGGMFILMDGTIQGSPFTAGVNAGNFNALGYDSITPAYCDGDIAEIIIYSAALSGTDRQNIEKYLGTKYGITVAGGTAVDPSTVSGLVGWWKADSLG